MVRFSMRGGSNDVSVVGTYIFGVNSSRYECVK